jgi:crossover junction endodeoxyribonuclease RusA
MPTLVLPYPISANRYWGRRIVKPKTGKPIIVDYVTPEARAYREEVAWIARAAGLVKPLQGRVTVEVDLYPHRPLDWQKRMRVDPLLWADTVQCIDLGNCEKVLGDALNGVGYVDDKLIWHMPLTKHEPDGKARVVVRLSPFVTHSPQGVMFDLLPLATHAVMRPAADDGALFVS